MALDPRLIELVRGHVFVGRPMPYAQVIIRRHVDAYLFGRLDYGALHIAIIMELMDLADKTFQQVLDISNRTSRPQLFASNERPTGVDGAMGQRFP